MNLYEETHPLALKDLLAQIHTNDTVLPNFQRNFVWDAPATMDLIFSIAQNYPAGSLLRIRNTRNLFAYREFEGAPPVNGKRPSYLILDGQQRLTSLYQALYGAGETLYYLDIRRLLAGADFNDCLLHLKSGSPEARRLEDEAVQCGELILPLGLYRAGAGDFGRWALCAARAVTGSAARADLETRLGAVHQKWIHAIEAYQFPVVTLSADTSPETACTIFEAVNRACANLSPFDLLTARFWHQGLDLRALWNKARAAHSILIDFQLDPYAVLQVIGLLARAIPSIQRADVMKLEKGQVENGWDDAIFGLQTTLHYLQDECGVLSPAYLPYAAVLVPMAGLMARTRHFHGPELTAAREKVGRWFWCAVFGQRYENAPNRQAVSDYSEGVTWLNGGQEPETVAGFHFDPAALRETGARQRAVYRGVLALVLRNQARDFASQRVLDIKVIQDHHVEDHPIFPSQYLARRRVPARQSECVLNRTLMDRETRARIGDRAPSIYLREILTARGEHRFTELLDSHLLPFGPSSSLWSDDFDEFLDIRQDALWAEIQMVTGVLPLDF